jgi:hypothetical protein
MINNQLNDIKIEEKQTQKKMMVRTVNISQQLNLLSESLIISVLTTYKTIEKYAYILHNKDINEDNTKKEAHWHIVIQFKSQVDLLAVSKWFNIPANFIQIPKGHNAFIQCCQYLTHETEKEQDAGKFRYSDGEIKSNFDFRFEVDKYVEKSLLKTDKDKLYYRKKVLLQGLKLSQIPLTDYAEDWKELQKCRAEYIRNFAELPNYRVNFYITGGSGTGKSLSSRALAKTLIDPENKLKNDEVFFVVGQGASMFSGYDGQPVLIWDDLRAMDLLKQFNNNPGSIFNLFDVIPSSSQQNVKFGSVKLINTINIVNSVQHFNEFVNVICFKNVKSEIIEPDKQLYRRFPFFVELSANQKYDFFVNKQFFNEDEPNYKAYLQHKSLGIGLLKIEQAYKKDTEKKQKLTNKHFEKVDEQHKKAIAIYNESSDDEILNLQQQLDLEIKEIENKIIEVVDYEIKEKEIKEKEIIQSNIVFKKW